MQVLGLFVLAGLSVSAYSYECDKSQTVCETSLVISQFVTMMHPKEKAVYPTEGRLYKYDVTNTSGVTPIDPAEVVVGDGFERQQVVVVANKSLPGPDIIVYEGQRLIVHVINELPAEGVSIHWHGLPMRGTPYMDGVAFITQCPINPNSKFTYDFYAEPKGTYWYHSHIGPQRVKGVLGALVIREREDKYKLEEHIMQIQDWNHDNTADLVSQHADFGIYKDRVKYKSSQSLDGSFFSNFDVQTGLINGKGRYKDHSSYYYNESPLEVFKVRTNGNYRFRVIGVGALYPFRVSIDNHTLLMIATDGYDFQPMLVESFVINPGERYDFILTANQPIDNYLIRVKTLEVNRHTVGFAILRYEGAPEADPGDSSKMIPCTETNKCHVLNCPYSYHPTEDNTICHNIGEVKSAINTDPAPTFIPGQSKEYFFNLGFPGVTSWPASINGRKFKLPAVSAISQPDQITTTCDKEDCGEEKQCHCTHTIDLHHGDTVQMVFSNMGNGRGWSHPLHMHGHSFYVLKTAFATYNETTGRFIEQNSDINCRGNLANGQAKSFCNSPTWNNPTWGGNNIPGLELRNPPRKDTLIVPSGGYVVLRIRADNPGLWILHCHIDLHAGGMSMLLNESFPNLPPVPPGFPACNSFPPARVYENPTTTAQLEGPPQLPPELGGPQPPPPFSAGFQPLVGTGNTSIQCTPGELTLPRLV